ncbi:MAG TPA: aminotransferase class III-fold pyridoxal phosphate-dependent enzyme, partial [Thermodesulfovibrionia bacterium]|nr:aminotransferase class III-fold pyridoxal phosphate-dependent enzyme [Thermodesulfovibrionia bacterium]
MIKTQEIRNTLYSLLEELLHTAPDEENRYVPFLEMGANSLTLMELIRSIEKTFGVKLAFRQFFEEITHLEALVSYLERHINSKGVHTDNINQEEKAVKAADNPSAPSVLDVQSNPLPSFNLPKPLDLEGVSGELESIFQSQLQLASSAMLNVITEQLNFLKGGAVSSSVIAADKGQKTTPVQPKPETPKDKPQSVLPFPKLQIDPAQAGRMGLNDRQQQHLSALIERFNKKTAKSKEQTQAFRSVLAENRASAGFRFTTKEMLYPLIGEKGSGCRITDIDGNEYVDMAMGFGVNLFGHNPDFVVEALKEQIGEGILIGPQSKLAGKVAELVSELTGMERVAFCNSGTEAVMTALRLAKTATGRQKIASFEGSYHGHFDGTLGMAQGGNANPQAVPATTGVTPNMVADLMLLDYGNPQSLDVIRRHAHELA